MPWLLHLFHPLHLGRWTEGEAACEKGETNHVSVMDGGWAWHTPGDCVGRKSHQFAPPKGCVVVINISQNVGWHLLFCLLRTMPARMFLLQTVVPSPDLSKTYLPTLEIVAISFVFLWVFILIFDNCIFSRGSYFLSRILWEARENTHSWLPVWSGSF